MSSSGFLIGARDASTLALTLYRSTQAIAQTELKADPSVTIALRFLSDQIANLQNQLTNSNVPLANEDVGQDSPALSELTNKSGGVLAQGRIVVADTTTDEAVTTTTTALSTDIIGAVYLEGGIANNAGGTIITTGLANIFCDGDAAAILRGDLLTADGVAGRAAKVTGNSIQGAFAVALEPLASGQDVIAAVMFGFTLRDFNNVRKSLVITSSPHTLTKAQVLATPNLFCNVAGALTINWPPAADIKDAEVYVKDISGNASGNNITNDGNASENIDGATTQVINVDYDGIRITSDGTQLWTLP